MINPKAGINTAPRIAPMTSPEPYKGITWMTSAATAAARYELAEANEYMDMVKAPMSEATTAVLIEKLGHNEIPRRKVRKQT